MENFDDDSTKSGGGGCLGVCGRCARSGERADLRSMAVRRATLRLLSVAQRRVQLSRQRHVAGRDRGRRQDHRQHQVRDDGVVRGEEGPLGRLHRPDLHGCRIEQVRHARPLDRRHRDPRHGQRQRQLRPQGLDLDDRGRVRGGVAARYDDGRVRRRAHDRPRAGHQLGTGRQYRRHSRAGPHRRVERRPHQLGRHRRRQGPLALRRRPPLVRAVLCRHRHGQFGPHLAGDGRHRLLLGPLGRGGGVALRSPPRDARLRARRAVPRAERPRRTRARSRNPSD